MPPDQPAPRVLLAEDDPRLGLVLEQALSEAGWEVTLVGDGGAAWAEASEPGAHDVLLLDWMLPGRSGVDVVRALRADGVTTPAMVLTARDQVPDRVQGLDAGADDYLTKPFDLEELLARLRALHRRGATPVAADVLACGGLALDPAARVVTRDGAPVELTAREFDLLHLLLRAQGAVVTRDQVLAALWDPGTDLRSNAIDVHVAGLRAKVDRPFGTATVTTVRGVGFRVDAGSGG
ncbi:response regulator transcription factor [Nocardioides sp. GY 10127]|uniref:response regulator transcription factor n=1 Tax=Nocardioides sp. GY 10127 TaxID=2569762 RepID=UPI0010A90622|nr:response regulator transcription factor [Nocardioides sp. GY 10127]TIC79282.1 response regulator transcription factor [Nocardioides sp. GY 10127]